MTHRLSPQARRALVFGAAATAVYAAMIFGSLARLEALSGLPPFDMRPSGYSAAEAEALLFSLQEAGRALYLRVQLPLDTVYPALMALTLASLFALLGRGGGAGWLVRCGIWLSWAAAGFDYAENAGIAAMLLSWDALSPALPAVTAAATVAKSVITTGAVTLLLGLSLWVLAQRWRTGPQPAREGV